MSIVREAVLVAPHDKTLGRVAMPHGGYGPPPWPTLVGPWHISFETSIKIFRIFSGTFCAQK